MTFFKLPLPWQWFKTVDPKQEYTVVVTYLSVKQFGLIPRFLGGSFAVQKQLKNTPGVVGYSLLADPFKRNFWTMTVWDNDEAIGLFSSQSPHRELIKNSSLYVDPEKMKLIRFKVKGETLPLKWRDALSKF